METTRDAFLDGAIEVLQPAKDGHRAGMDALLLAASVPQDTIGRVADFGAGCGVVGMAVAHRCAGTQVDLVEREVSIAQLARDGLALEANSHICERVSVVEADLTASANIRREAGLPENAYDIIIANPPFNDGNHRVSPGAYRRQAHVLGDGDLTKWVKAAATSLKAKGAFSVIVRPSNLPDLLSALDGPFGSISVLPIHPGAEKPARRIIVSAKLGGRGALQILPLFIVHDTNGGFTEQADAIFKGQSELSVC